MIDIRRILCPTDFSEASRHALDHAAALARWYEASVHLLYVHPIVVVPTYGPGVPLLPGALLSPQDRQAVEQNLLDWVQQEIGTGIQVECEVREGETANEIVQTVSERAADLVVLGTHGRAGLERFAMGSVAEKVLRKATCPVMTVPPRVGDVVPVPSSLFRRVLCAIDFSDSSMRALEYAVSLAQEAGGQLTLMHVVELLPEDVGLESSWATQRTVADYVAAARTAGQARLEAAVPDAARQYCEVETVLGSGKPYREILREAAARQSDLLVLGVHGRNPLDLLVFGSTAQQVVRRADCPVLTVRTNER
jgi:nucleotide-binding universal stress UspA family protein